MPPKQPDPRKTALKPMMTFHPPKPGPKLPELEGLPLWKTDRRLWPSMRLTTKADEEDATEA